MKLLFAETKKKGEGRREDVHDGRAAGRLRGRPDTSKMDKGIRQFRRTLK